MYKCFILCIFLVLNTFCVAESSFEQHIRYSPDKSNPIGYLDIVRDRPIDESTYLYVKFALEDYVKKGAIFVILHLNTPGGEVFSAMKIAELLQQLDAVHHIPVVAVVDNWALSAGAMLAYSCRYIAVSSAALMGAAQPVMSGGEGKMESAPEKIVSALRAEFASLAKTYGRNPLIAEAMVDKDIFLVKRGKEIVQLQEGSKRKASDEVITPGGKLLTLDAEQLLKLHVADMKVPTDGLLAMPFFSKIPQTTLITYSDWKIDFFAFLTLPIVASLLMMGLMIGVYMEMSHPGIGVAGLIALTCLSFILISNFATAAIGWLEVLLVVLGIILLLAEIFILPGFGIIGILGIALILFGLIAGMLPAVRAVDFSWDLQQWSLQGFAFLERLLYVSLALIFSLIIISLISRFVTPRLLKRSRIILQETEGEKETVSLPPVGTEGEAFTPLRPGGKILIKNILYEASADTSYVERGEKVVVSKIQGSVIIVAKTNLSH